MSNHEIEDVLSSIRRLVSEDLRPAPKADSAIEAEAAEQKPAPLQAAAKLLLTPSLRVIDEPVSGRESVDEQDLQDRDEADQVRDFDDDALAFEPADDTVVPESREEAGTFEETDVQDVVSRLGAAVGDDDEEWESPVGDPAAWDDASTPNSQAGETMHGRLHFRPTHEDEFDEVLDNAHDFDVEDHFVESDVDDEDLGVAEEPAAAPRRVVNPPSDDWAEAAEAEVRAELERDVEETAESMFAANEVTFDEEVLRDLVRDIIREELAGTLGERITRNVRKLVRAEIARALAVREFE